MFLDLAHRLASVRVHLGMEGNGIKFSFGNMLKIK